MDLESHGRGLGRDPGSRAAAPAGVRGIGTAEHRVRNDDEIDELWASIVDALAELRDFDSKQQVLAMFDADLIDPTEIDRESYLDALTEPPSSEKKPPFDIFAMYARVAKFNTPKDV